MSLRIGIYLLNRKLLDQTLLGWASSFGLMRAPELESAFGFAASDSGAGLAECKRRIGRLPNRRLQQLLLAFLAPCFCPILLSGQALISFTISCFWVLRHNLIYKLAENSLPLFSFNNSWF
jgi:hypothetical protein